jgi:hypothetical protein
LINAWRSREWGLPYSRGWKNETAGSLEKMSHALNVYTAFRRFEERGEMTEVKFSEQYFDLWRIVIDVEKLERDNA